MKKQNVLSSFFFVFAVLAMIPVGVFVAKNAPPLKMPTNTQRPIELRKVTQSTPPAFAQNITVDPILDDITNIEPAAGNDLSPPAHNMDAGFNHSAPSSLSPDAAIK